MSHIPSYSWRLNIYADPNDFSTFTAAPFFQNKIARAWKGYIRVQLRGGTLFLSSNPEYQSSSRPSMSPRKGQTDAAFSTSWKRHASFVTVTTSASRHEFASWSHNSLAPVRSVSWLIRMRLKYCSRDARHCYTAMCNAILSWCWHILHTYSLHKCRCT